MIRTEVETCREICSDLCKIKDLKENVQQDDCHPESNPDFHPAGVDVFLYKLSFSS